MSAKCPLCDSVLDHPVQETASFDDLTLNLVNRTCRRGAKEIKLSAREFAALLYLVRNPNRALTRTDIAQHAWGIMYDGLTNEIDVYISYLRRKIDSAGRPLIHTVRGIGYKLAVEPEAASHETASILSI